MVKNQRNLQPATRLQWADCHIPHTDHPIPGARSQAERETPLPSNGNHHSPIGNQTGSASSAAPDFVTSAVPRIASQYRVWNSQPIQSVHFQHVSL